MFSERQTSSEAEFQSFDSQFGKKDKLAVAGGDAEIFDLKPEAQKTEVPVFLAPAWACTAEVYRPAIRTLFDSKRRVITMDHPRIGGGMGVIPEDLRRKYPNEELRKALNMLEILDIKGIRKTDIIAHSEGAINAIIAATLHPERFRNIVLYAPAGMIGNDNFIRLLKGFAGQFKGRPESMSTVPVTETERGVAKAAGRQAVKYIAKNPVRSGREAMDIASSQIHEMLRQLHEQGIGIVVMSAVDDPVFPPEKMQRIAKADMLDGFLSVRGGHGEIGAHPEKYMVVAEQMLSKLENK